MKELPSLKLIKAMIEKLSMREVCWHQIRLRKQRLVKMELRNMKTICATARVEFGEVASKALWSKVSNTFWAIQKTVRTPLDSREELEWIGLSLVLHNLKISFPIGNKLMVVVSSLNHYKIHTQIISSMIASLLRTRHLV